jgi:very-short-patch-repair endonuclease
MNSTTPRWRASKEMQARARELRKEMTPAEKRLWQHLCNGQLDGAQFRKQHAVDTYIVDFFCAKSKLVIEVDGDSHAEQIEYDAARTQWLSEQHQYRVLRFTNHDMLTNIEAVVEAIRAAL